MFKKKVYIKNFPTHIAFIMDGNRRWATSKGLFKTLGHKQGGIALKNIVDALLEYPEIRYASFFAFSTENWNREQSEIDYIFSVCYDMVEKWRNEFVKKNVKFVAMGDLDRFPQKMQDILKDTMQMTQDNTGLVVNLAMNYGGRDDIVHAANVVASSGQKITVENLKANLYSAGCPDIDLVVRTSGELRVSNFMLFQMAYSEFYFTKTYWPDFDKKELEKALIDFSKRNRRFGGK
jgi:undecaprenyl diphosphate synthase